MKTGWNSGLSWTARRDETIKVRRERKMKGFFQNNIVGNMETAEKFFIYKFV